MKITPYLICAALALGLSSATQAHVSVDIGVGPAWPVYRPPIYAAPVYTPWPPVRYVPAPVIIYNGPVYRSHGYWHDPYYRSYPYYWRNY